MREIETKEGRESERESEKGRDRKGEREIEKEKWVCEKKDERVEIVNDTSSSQNDKKK